MSDQYARAAIQVAVAQLVEAAGFDASQQSSLDVLNDLLIQYMTHIGAAAHSYAELAGRTTPNAVDVASSIQELGVSVTDLQRYATAQEDLPFAQTVTNFPIEKKLPPRAPSFATLNEQPPPHVPPFFPALPDSHTYKDTPQYPTAVPPSIALPEQQRDGEEALALLQARLRPDNELLATMLPETAEEDRQQAPPDNQQQEQQVETHVGKKARQNPFLSAPVWEDQAPQGGETAPVSSAAPAGQGTSSIQQQKTTPQIDTSVWQEPTAINATGGQTLPPVLTTTADKDFQWAWVAKEAKSAANKHDGYEEPDDYSRHDKAARRQKRVQEGTKLAVERILAAHGEDLEGLGDEEAMLAREQI